MMLKTNYVNFTYHHGYFYFASKSAQPIQGRYTSNHESYDEANLIVII